MKKLFLFAAGAAILFPLAGCDRNMKFSPVDMWNRSRYKPLEPEPFFTNGSSTQAPVAGTVARGQLRTDELMYQGRRRGSGVAPLVMQSGERGMEPNGGALGGSGGSSGGSAGGSNGSVGSASGAGGAGGAMAPGGRTATGAGAMSGNRAAARTTARNSANGDIPLGDNGLGTDATLATTFPFPITKYVLQRGEDRYNAFCSPCHSRVGDGHGMIVERGFPAPPSFHIDRLRKAPVGHYFDVITNGYGVMYPYGSRVETRDRWAIIAYIRLMQSRSAKYGIDGPQTDVQPSSPIFNGGRAYNDTPAHRLDVRTKNSLPNSAAGTEPSNPMPGQRNPVTPQTDDRAHPAPHGGANQ